MGIVRQSLTGNYQPHGLEVEADVILAFSFGRGDERPGVVNESLANFALGKARDLGIGLVAQYAVAEAAEQLGTQGVEPFLRVDPRTAWERNYMHTGHILKRVIEGGLIDPASQQVMVVAQAFHAPRADSQAQAAGLETILPPDLPRGFASDTIFRELHCRNRLLWSLREPLTLLQHAAFGQL